MYVQYDHQATTSSQSCTYSAQVVLNASVAHLAATQHMLSESNQESPGSTFLSIQLNIPGLCGGLCDRQFVLLPHEDDGNEMVSDSFL